jgi:antitoxin (DNA-binding transcriptional repressor) of toxin-antitoxin stability system
MKRLGVREFRDHATQYLAGDEVLVIERHGEPIGCYIPMGTHRARDATEALDRLEQTVERVLAATGLTEEELSRLFDLTQPLPESTRSSPTQDPSTIHASGG